MINRTITKKQKKEEKQLYGYFKQQTSEISYIKTWIRLRRGNIKRETESILIAAQKQRHKDQLYQRHKDQLY